MWMTTFLLVSAVAGGSGNAAVLGGIYCACQHGPNIKELGSAFTEIMHRPQDRHYRQRPAEEEGAEPESHRAGGEGE